MTLDRAFIKAYAEARPVGGCRPSTEGPIIAMIVPELEPPPRASQPLPQPTTPVKAPLSTFVPPVRTEEKLQAGLEVDALAWPKPCVDLLHRARRGWDRFIEPLVEASTQGCQCVAIASCMRGEGRTTIALATAKHLAARGQHAVVVDADFENAGLAHSVGIAPQAGWGDVVHGELPLGEALIYSPADNVTIMPWQGRTAQPHPLAKLTRTATCFEALRETFDLVLVDTAPLASGPAIADFVQLAEAIRLDAVYLAYDARFATPKQLKDVSASLERAGIRLAGIIENFVGAANLNDAGPHNRLPSFAGRALAPQA